MDKQILYIHEHQIKDVCKIWIGTISRAKNAYKYQSSDKDSKKNKLAIFSFKNFDALVIENLCKHILKRINSTEFYAIDFYKACTLFTLLWWEIDEINSQHIDKNKIAIKVNSKLKNSIPLTQRFTDLIRLLLTKEKNVISQVKDELNNNGKRNVLLTKKEYEIYNKFWNRTGWKSYNDERYYRTWVDSTAISKYIKIIERNIL
jgi:hypothetical protein